MSNSYSELCEGYKPKYDDDKGTSERNIYVHVTNKYLELNFHIFYLLNVF